MRGGREFALLEFGRDDPPHPGCDVGDLSGSQHGVEPGHHLGAAVGHRGDHTAQRVSPLERLFVEVPWSERELHRQLSPAVRLEAVAHRTVVFEDRSASRQRVASERQRRGQEANQGGQAAHTASMLQELRRGLGPTDPITQRGSRRVWGDSAARFRLAAGDSFMSLKVGTPARHRRGGRTRSPTSTTDTRPGTRAAPAGNWW